MFLYLSINCRNAVVSFSKYGIWRSAVVNKLSMYLVSLYLGPFICDTIGLNGILGL